eukprot:m.97702 g.97702  ORF g.97702 m.97702 type:complete len:717 (+) comp27002_c0_seq1:212-2362(+)
MSMTCIILDVSRGMQEGKTKDAPSQMELAVNAINMFIQTKMFHGKKTEEVAFILVGCAESDNALYENGGAEYQHIWAVRDFDTADLALTKFISNSIREADEPVDFLDSVIVALDLFVKRLATKTAKKRECKKDIFYFSNFKIGFDDPEGQIETVIQGLNDEGITFKAIGIPEVDEEEDEKPPVNEGPAAVAVRNLISKLPGSKARSLDEAVTILSEYHKTNVNPAASNMLLEIGDFKINCAAKIRMQSAKAITFKRISPFATDKDEYPTPGGIKTIRLFMNQNGEQIEDEEDIKKGYRYGKDVIPFVAEDADAISFKGERSLRIICFAPEDRIPREHFTGSKLTSFQAKDGDYNASVAMSALCTAMKELKVYGIFRFISRAKQEPTVYALWPHIKDDYEVLLGVRLPYMDDVKDFTLPPLDDNTKKLPTKEGQAAMDQFVQKMDLMEAFYDEDGDPMEAVQPKDTFNPVHQRMYECIVHRSLNPEDPLPKLDPMLKRYIEPHKDLWSRTTMEAEKLKLNFTLKSLDRKKRKEGQQWDEEDGKPDDESATKKAKLEEESVASVLGSTTVKRIGDGVSVVKDFVSLITTANLLEATTQFQTYINQKIELYLGGATDIGTCTFLECIQIMRTKCLEGEEPVIFNTYLEALKTNIEKKKPHLNKYKSQLSDAKTSFITRVECKKSDIEPTSAILYADVVEEVATPAPMEEDDDDDDLDEL